MHPQALDHLRATTRRRFLQQCGTGMGALALSSLFNDKLFAADSAMPILGKPHFAPKAKNIIYLFQSGGPSHLDLFDPKPELTKRDGQQVPEELVKNIRLAQIGKDAKLLASPYKFAQYGKSGMWLSELLPQLRSIVDDVCFIKSMHTGAVNHAPAITFFLTGSEMPGRPSMGAWATYGLGTEGSDLPGFVVMTSRDKEASCGQIFYDFYWASGFLPSKYQGVKFRGGGDPVLYLSNPDGVSREVRRGLLDDLAKLNQRHFEEYGDPEIVTRIAQYEMAYKMQASVPELTDFSKEPASVLQMYGPDVKRPGSFAYNCLMARRLAERGCRFTQLLHAGWDHHRNLSTQFEIQCRDTDQPAAALVKDLKMRGMLDDTLVIWGGEFGRTPFIQGDIANRAQWGRDHHPYAFTIWMAGAGIKPGISYGASDEFAFNAVENPVDVHDFQATVMHQLGIDHERLTFRFQGRQYRLTDVHGKVVKGVVV